MQGSVCLFASLGNAEFRPTAKQHFLFGWIECGVLYAASRLSSHCNDCPVATPLKERMIAIACRRKERLISIRITGLQVVNEAALLSAQSFS
ncbi:MAG: hypothetical protein R3B90_03005 [Planctomycetaceae bacterium]